MRRHGLLAILMALLGALLAGALAVAAADRSGGASAPGTAGLDGGEIARHAVVLEVEETELRELQKACRDAGFTAEEFSRLMTLVTRAKLAGLPHEQLIDKLDEGLAKRAMPERVMRALEAKARRLRDAKEVVDQLIVQGWMAPDYRLAVGLVADALGAGSTPAGVVRAVRNRGAGKSEVPDVRTAFVAPSRRGR